MGAKKVKTPSHEKEALKYDPSMHTVIVASITRPCLNCGKNSIHKESTCK